jgi:archaemetzincin
MPSNAWYEPRRRYRAERLLSHLAADVIPGSGCTAVLGFTRLDISTTKGEHSDWGMLGMALIGERTSIISTHRMGGRRVARRLKAMRAVKVANHELGHALGLHHHDVDGCVMADVAGTVKTVDRGPGLLCEDSRQELGRHGFQLPALRRFDWPSVLKTAFAR